VAREVIEMTYDTVGTRCRGTGNIYASLDIIYISLGQADVRSEKPGVSLCIYREIAESEVKCEPSLKAGPVGCCTL